MTNLIRLKQIETGSLTEPNWNSISGIPSGIVSQSTDLSSLNQFTASYFTDSSSVDSKILTESGRIDAILSASNANVDTFVEVVNLINSVDLTNDIAFASFYTSSNAKISSIEITTGSLIDRLNTIENVSGSWVTENETGSFLTSLNGAISGAGQILDLGFVTGSYTTINEFNSLTQSFNSISQSVTTISGNIGDVDFNGIISGSSQLTSSFDERYTLSGSIQPLPNGLISGSSQITSSLVSFGFPTTSSTDILSNKTLNNPLLSSFRITSDGSSRMNTYGNNVEFFSNDGFLLNPATDRAVYIDSYDNQNKVVINSDLSEYETTGRNIISGSSQLTSSFDERYTLSGSVQPLPNGLISGSSQLTSSFDDRYILSSSYSSDSSSFDSRFNGLVTTGSNTFSGSQVFSGSMTVTSGQVIASTITNNSSSLFLQSGSNLYVQNDGVLEITGSIVLNGTTYTSLTGSGTIPAGTISGSSQLTSSYDTRYTLSGSVQNIQLPSNLVSGSSQLTSSYDSRYSLSGSVLTSFSSSVDNRLDTLEASIITGSVNYTQVKGPIKSGVTSTGVVIISGSITTTGNPVQIMVTGDANPINVTSWTRLQIYRDDNGIGNIIQVENSSNLNVPYCLNVIDTPPAGTYTYSMRTVSAASGEFQFGEYDGPLLTAIELKSQTSFQGITLISGSSQLTSSYDERYVLSGSITQTTWDNIASKPSGIISGSSQLTTFETKGSGIYSSSAQLPSGIISGSSQLTSSYDTRYTLSGSVVSGTTPDGTISGSSQLTSSFDGRYTQTGSFNSLTASFNSFTASAQSVTTGSNIFNGTQTITGSLNITNGNIIASEITANTASLYLTSGSNLYVQNNGAVEITGSLTVNGITRFETVGGDEGGEIEFGVPQTNTTLSTRVVQDIFQNRLRIFDGNTKGVFIDLSKAPTGVAGEITWKASGYVDAGTFVQLDNIKATVTTSGNRGLSIGAVSTNFSANIGGTFSNSAGAGGNSTQNIAYTTTASTSVFGWNFIAEADTSTYIINDKTNSRMYRITMMIGPAYLGNFILIERLH